MKNSITWPKTWPRWSFENFTPLNYKEVLLGWPEIARTFQKVNLNEEYPMLSSKEYPSSFYLRTESGNVCQIIQNGSPLLYNLLKNDRKKINYIQENAPSDRLLYNPRTKKITAIEKNIIELGKQFHYAPKCNTSTIKEIVWISGSQKLPFNMQTRVESTIKKDFISLSANV